MPQKSKHSTRQSGNQKKPSRKKKSKKPTSGKNFKKSLLTVLGVFVMLAMVAFGYFLGKQNSTLPKETVSPHKLEKQTKKIAKKESKIIIAKTAIKEEQNQTKEAVGVEENKPKRVYVKPLHGKPKLVIIIDDVSSKRQLKKIQALNMKITPSIFPPSERSMKSHRLARGLKHYMIHLPMESGSRQFNTQYKTLKTFFTAEQITARVKELRKLFPHAKYINNHTGSVFTDHYKSMHRLYVALKKEGFMFVDSRTIASTKVPKITKQFGDAYVYRDVFIDNVHNVAKIHQQLKKAVSLAKQRGYAIAIGHPHAVTMKALSTAGTILKEVELIYIDDLMTI